MIFRIHLIILASTRFALASEKSGISENSFIDSIVKKLGTLEAVGALEGSSPLAGHDDGRLELKQIEAFGINFSGQAAFQEASLQSVTFWCDDPNLAPDAAQGLFTRIADAFRPRIGEGQWVKDVPSFEDASETDTQVRLWLDGDEMIVLSITVYPTRAGLSLQRTSRSAWEAQMGADQGQFWEKTLKINRPAEPQANLPPSPLPAHSSTASKPLGSRPAPKLQPLAAAELAPPSEGAASPRWLPWVMGVVGSAGLIGLLWRWVKRRE